MINYEIVVCYQHIFNKDNYYYNFGFYVGCLLLTIIFIFLLIYIFVGRTSLRLQYLHRQPKPIEIKNYERNFSHVNIMNTRVIMNANIDKPKKRSKSSKNVKIFAKKKKKLRLKQRLITNIHLKRINFEKNSNSSPPLRRKLKKISRKTGKNKNHINKRMLVKFNIDEIKVSQDEMIEHTNSINEHWNKITPKNNENDVIRVNSFETNKNNNGKIDYFELPYSKALEKDNRNFIQTFISIFNLKLECIQIIFYPREFTHKSLTIPLYLLDLLLDLTINAFLFSDEVISQKYFNNGELEFITTNTLSIVSNIATNFILFLIEKLINQYEIMIIVTREIKNVNNYYRIYFKLISFFKIKIRIFFIILFLIGLFCIYYLFVFCSIYKRIQKELFINYLVGSVWSLGFTIVICLMITILRLLAIKKRNRRLYIISTYIDQKF